ncbi:YjbH domain-containing protein [Yoonia sp.]|uniref:YjbH domain-containing protein n=1 Tax=Yoonia sp. TaxID=2212373 RepID=UPI002FDA5ED4
MRIAVWTPVSVFALAAAGQVAAQDSLPNYSFYGTPGLLEMPSADTPDEGAFATTLSYRDGLFQTVLTFQLTDRVSASVRNALVDLYGSAATDIDEDVFERGFDLQVTLVEEGTYLPEVAVGLRDFLTPGRLQSEYVVATKSIGDNLTVTAGLGWGAMAQRDGFDNPISSRAVRPVFDVSEPDGQLGTDQWFAGDAALFGGLDYRFNDRWGVVAEYSTLSYPQDPNSPALDGESPYSIGVTYRPNEAMQFTAAALNGNNLAVSGSFFLNANTRPGKSGIESAPLPVRVRSDAERAAATGGDQIREAAIRNALVQAFRAEGLNLVALDIDGDTARVRFTNGAFRSNAQAMGRISRILTQAMPAQVEVFVLEQMDRGIPLSAIRVMRSDIESLENRAGAAETLRQRTAFVDAGGPEGLTPVNEFTPQFSWGFSPYFRLNPILASGGSISFDAGAALNASYRLSPQMGFNATIQQSLVNNDGSDPGPDSTPNLQNVRTDGGDYGDDGLPVLQSLTFSHYGRPGTNLYSRVSAGYLERMFGGVSTEVLWKPVDSRFGIGAELNYVAQRNTDMWFGFDEYDYQVATGHISAYYDLGNGYHTQVDVGRYLAGDWGATLEIAREYDNGIRIAASITQTEVSYEEFGNGSYNKGISITLPQDFFTGRASQGSYAARFSTRNGDGGARLNVGGRLYDIVRGAHEADLTDTWGRYWR